MPLICKAHLAHAAALRELLAALRELLAALDYAGAEPFIEQHLAQLLIHADARLLVAEKDERVLGFLSLHFIPQLGDFCRISYFCVAAGACGLGVAASASSCTAPGGVPMRIGFTVTGTVQSRPVPDKAPGLEPGRESRRHRRPRNEAMGRPAGAAPADDKIATSET